MFTITGTKIYLTRGDSADISVTLTNMDGTPYELQPGDTVYFRMKQKVTNEESQILIEKTAYISQDEIVISLDEPDTMELPFGKYHYEIELVTDDGRHYTVVVDADFEVGKELENHGE